MNKTRTRAQLALCIAAVSLAACGGSGGGGTTDAARDAAVSDTAVGGDASSTPDALADALATDMQPDASADAPSVPEASTPMDTGGDTSPADVPVAPDDRADAGAPGDAPVAVDVLDVAPPIDSALDVPSVPEAGVDASVCEAGTTQCGSGSTASCVNTQSDPANCGACGTACRMGQACTAGVCACPTGTLECGGICVDTQASASHCGGCGRACAAGQGCVAGACACPSGRTLCGGACVDSGSDAANCGACGAACGSARACVMGACVCPTGQTACGTGAATTCVSAQTDNENCGACGARCAGGGFCMGGTCQCAPGETRCGTGATAACLNLQSDRANCGACGTACAAGQVCNGGVCTVDCSTPRTRCGLTTCTDTQTDDQNCGGCGTACGPVANASGGICSTGRCVPLCGAGFGNCDGTYANGCEATLANDENHCGACGNRCAAGQLCIAGLCGATSCRQIHTADPALPSGLYTIDADGAGPEAPLQVYCDMTTNGGGWTLVQRTVADFAESRTLITNYATFYGTTLGSPQAGRAYRMAARLWPGLQSVRDHLMVHTAARTDGSSCAPLRYRVPAGTWVITSTGARLTGLVDAGNNVDVFNTYRLGQANPPPISTTDVGPATGCTNSAMAVPWTYDSCCFTCPSFGSGYFSPPRPMASYLNRPDVNGDTAATACAGGAPVLMGSRPADPFFGLTAMEYFVR